MKNITKIFMLALLFFSLTDKASAQGSIFEVDALTTKSAALYSYTDTIPGNGEVILGDPLPGDGLKNGTKVTILSKESKRDAKFKSERKKLFSKENKTYSGTVYIVRYTNDVYKDTLYYMNAKDLRLSSEDPNYGKKGADFINAEKNPHTFWGHFYSSFWPYVLIFLLLIAAMVFTFLIPSKNGPRLIPTILVPAFLLLAVMLEMLGVVLMGRSGVDILWWLNTNVYKEAVVILRLMFFALALILQIFSMRLYKNSMVGYMHSHEQKVQVKRPITGALVGAVLLGISVIIAWFASNPDLYLGIGATLLIASIVVSIVSTAVINSKAMGKDAGIAFTLFVVVYGIGLIFALVLLIAGLIKGYLFWEMLVTIIVGALVLLLLNKFVPVRSYTENGVNYEAYDDYKLLKSKKNKS